MYISVNHSHPGPDGTGPRGALKFQKRNASPGLALPSLFEKKLNPEIEMTWLRSCSPFRACLESRNPHRWTWVLFIHLLTYLLTYLFCYPPPGRVPCMLFLQPEPSWPSIITEMSGGFREQSESVEFN